MSSEWEKISQEWPALTDENIQLIWLEGLSHERFESKALSLLDEEEKKRAQSFHFKKDQQKFANARACLRIILAQILGMKNYYVSIVYNEFFKPMLAEEFGLYFNLSHSADAALFAFSKRGNVGVDLEFMAEDRNIYSIASKHFTNEEHAFLTKGNAGEKLKRFYQLWTAKEALLKAEGKGLWEGLPQTLFPHEDFVQKRKVEKGKHELISLNPPDEAFQASLCLEGKISKIDCYQASLENIFKLI